MTVLPFFNLIDFFLFSKVILSTLYFYFSVGLMLPKETSWVSFLLPKVTLFSQFCLVEFKLPFGMEWVLRFGSILLREGPGPVFALPGLSILF